MKFNTLFNNKRLYQKHNFGTKIKNASNEDLSMVGLNTTLGGMFGTSLYFESKSKYTQNEKIYRIMMGLLTTMCASGAIYHIIKIFK
jgi:hypothetical protein